MSEWLGIADATRLKVRAVTPAEVPSDTGSELAELSTSIVGAVRIDVEVHDSELRHEKPVLDLLRAFEEEARSWRLEEALVRTSAHLGMAEMMVRDVAAHYPARQDAKQLDIVGAVSRALGSAATLEGRLVELSSDKSRHQANRRVLLGHEGAQALPAAQLTCLVHGRCADGPGSARGTEALQAVVKQRRVAPHRVVAEAEDEATLKALRGETRAKLTQESALVRLLRRVQAVSRWPAVQLPHMDVPCDLEWNFALDPGFEGRRRENIDRGLGPFAAHADAPPVRAASVGRQASLASVLSKQSSAVGLRSRSMSRQGSGRFDMREVTESATRELRPVSPNTLARVPEWWARGRVCYHCASARVRMADSEKLPRAPLEHRFVDCPKRRAAAELEYMPGAIALACKELSDEQEEISREAGYLRPVFEEYRAVRAELYVLEGRLQLISAVEAVKHASLVPPPRPPGRQVFLGPLQWIQTQQAVLARHAVLARVLGGAVEDASTLGDSYWRQLKGVSELGPPTIRTRSPISPDEVRLRSSSTCAHPTPPHPIPPHPIPPHPIPSHPNPPLPLPSPSHPQVRLQALELNLPLMENAATGQLLWLALDALVAPLPKAWRQEGRSYVHNDTGEVSGTHPLIEPFRALVRGLSTRTPAALQPLAQVDSLAWMLFTGSDGVPFYHNFASSQTQLAFPDLRGTAASALLRRRACSVTVESQRAALPTFIAAAEYTAQLLASGVSAVKLEAAFCAPRSLHLWMRPSLLSELLMMANYLSIDAVAEPQCMWLAHLALVLPVPLGWTAHERDGAPAEARPRDTLVNTDRYYYNSLLRASQWEPPQWTFCRGVLEALRRSFAESSFAAPAPPSAPAKPRPNEKRPSMSPRMSRGLGGGSAAAGLLSNADDAPSAARERKISRDSVKSRSVSRSASQDYDDAGGAASALPHYPLEQCRMHAESVRRAVVKGVGLEVCIPSALKGPKRAGSGEQA